MIKNQNEEVGKMVFLIVCFKKFLLVHCPFWFCVRHISHRLLSYDWVRVERLQYHVIHVQAYKLKPIFPLNHSLLLGFCMVYVCVDLGEKEKRINNFCNQRNGNMLSFMFSLTLLWQTFNTLFWYEAGSGTTYFSFCLGLSDRQTFLCVIYV